jgi:TRAP transporter TAXI family solute receptor
MKLVRLLAVFAAVMPAVASAQTIGIISTPPGSYTHSASTAVAKAIADHSNLDVRVQPQGASPMYGVDAGAAQFGIANNFDNIFFQTGTGTYEGEGEHHNIRIVGKVTPLAVALYVKNDSPIHSLKDLKGKRLGGGFTAQKTILRTNEAYLALVGLTYDDLRPVMTANVVSGADDFASGKADAFSFALGSAKVKEVNAKVGGIRALDVVPTPAGLKRLQELLPGSYISEVKPSPGLDGIERPTHVLTYDFLLIVNASVPDDIVYKVTKAVHDGRDSIVATFPPMRGFDPATMAAKSYAPLKYHPGAIKYYQEIGQWPPSQS